MSPRDVGLFVQSAKTDAAIARLKREVGSAAAFEAVYRQRGDPWASAAPGYQYQRRKYEKLVSFLPERRFGRALDLGCGLGLLTQRLATRADDVLGIDLSPTAVQQAQASATHLHNVRFMQSDVVQFSTDETTKFDLVVIADVLYYLDDLADESLKALASRIASLLTPHGLCLLADHFFFGLERDSRLTKRIHEAFHWCPLLRLQARHWRPFYLVSLLER